MTKEEAVIQSENGVLPEDLAEKESGIEVAVRIKEMQGNGVEKVEVRKEIKEVRKIVQPTTGEHPEVQLITEN